MLRTYRCFNCGRKFQFLHHPADEPPPGHCPYRDCGASFRDDIESAAPEQVNIGGSPIARSVDKMYRDLETTSAARAEASGNPALKVTNLKDNLREGDVAAFAPQPSAEYQQMMKMLADGGVGEGGFSTAVAGHIGAAKMGLQGSGAAALEAIQNRHKPFGAPALKASR